MLVATSLSRSPCASFSLRCVHPSCSYTPAPVLTISRPLPLHPRARSRPSHDAQAQANLSDPVATPFPYIVPSHLRDLVLLSEHSPSRRAALWTRVAHVVEGNANVRVRDVEVNGEEMRGWQWTGPLAVAEDAEGAEAVERPKMVEGGARVLQSLAGSPVALGRAQ